MPAGIYVGYLRVNTQIDYRAYAYSPSNYTYCIKDDTYVNRNKKKGCYPEVFDAATDRINSRRNCQTSIDR